jgi:hypothetical protein
MRIQLTGAALLLLILPSCGPGFEYGTAVRNATAAPVRDAAVSIGPRRFTAGVLNAGAYKAGALAKEPLPPQAKARVEWRTPDGAPHVKEIALDRVVPAGFKKGVLTFELTDRGDVNVLIGALPGPQGTAAWKTPTPKT